MSIIQSLQDLVISGGFVMPPLILASSLLWYGLVQRLLVLRSGQGSLFEYFKKRLMSSSPEDAQVIISEAYSEFSVYKTLIGTIVMVSPLLGLLGTVSGMIETFDSLADMSLFTQSGGIAGGISQALVTTQMGLAVAIPGLVLGKVLSAKQNTLMNELERMGEEHA